MHVLIHIKFIFVLYIYIYIYIYIRAHARTRTHRHEHTRWHAISEGANKTNHCDRRRNCELMPTTHEKVGKENRRIRGQKAHNIQKRKRSTPPRLCTKIAVGKAEIAIEKREQIALSKSGQRSKLLVIFKVFSYPSVEKLS